MVAAASLSACSVVDTGPTRTTHAQGHRCDSMLGSYALPKTLLRIEVKGNDADPDKASTALTALEEISIADANRIYCLNHLSSPTAKDDISVVRGTPAFLAPARRDERTSTNLLTFISSNTIDYTADIIRKIIRTIFIALSGKPNFAPVPRSTALKAEDLQYRLANLTFDPFNLADVVRTNEALRPLGYCILLEIGSSDSVAQEGRRFCRDPDHLKHRRAKFEEAYAAYERSIDLPTQVPGILYRPRQPFRVFVYVKDDPKGSEAWRLIQTSHLKLENISPVLSLGIERAVFSARRTALLFDRGALVGWCVSKKSELLGAMEIPLEVARSIVALPASIIMVRIDEVTKGNSLLEAERDLVRAQREYIAYLLDPAKSPPAGKDVQDVKDVQTGAPAFPEGLVSVSDKAKFKPDEVARQADDFGDEFAKVCTEPSTALGTASSMAPKT